MLRLCGLPPDGVQKRHILFLRCKVHNGCGPAHGRRLGGFKKPSSKGAVVDMFIHASRQYVSACGIHNPVSIRL